MTFKTLTEIAQQEAGIRVEKIVDNYDFLLNGQDFQDLCDWESRMDIFRTWDKIDFECDEWEQGRTDAALAHRLEAFNRLDEDIRNQDSLKVLKHMYRATAKQIVATDHPSNWKAGLPCKLNEELAFLPKKDLICVINMISWKIHEQGDIKGYQEWNHYEEEESGKSEDALDQPLASLDLLL